MEIMINCSETRNIRRLSTQNHYSYDILTNASINDLTDCFQSSLLITTDTDEYHLEESVGGQSYGARGFILVAGNILSAKVFERLSVYVIHCVEQIVHVRLIAAYHPAITIIGGSKVGLHLVIPQLVDDKSKDLPLVRFVFKVFRQDRSETAVVAVPLRVRTT